MSVPLPNLDDIRWSDLVDEGRSLIPLYAPAWTDHNVHDPGITMIELLAWIAEMDIYSLNRISDEHKRKFLALVGVEPYPPSPARTIARFELKPGEPAIPLPAGTEVAGSDAFGEVTTFRTRAKLRIAPGTLDAVLLNDSKGYHDVTGKLERGEAIGVFGSVPGLNAEIYLGFTNRLRRRRPASLYFTFAGRDSGDDERQRLIEEARAQKRACQPPPLLIPCDHKGHRITHEEQYEQVLPPNDRVRVKWEFLAEVGGQEQWLPLNPKRQEIEDDTRVFTLDGGIVFRVPRRMAKSSNASLTPGLYYVRCRLEAGAFDAPPLIQTVSFNAVSAEQAVPINTTLKIRSGVVATGSAPVAGDSTAVRFELDHQLKIKTLSFNRIDADDPEFRVLEYTAASANSEGSLTIEAVVVGRATAVPKQEHTLPRAPIVQESLRLFTLESSDWREWERRSDLDASGVDDAHFVVNTMSGDVRFGDGKQGRLPELESLILARYDSTRAEEGNLGVGKIKRLADSLHNRATIKDFDAVNARIAITTNPVAATRGRAAESLGSATGRAIELVGARGRAVTLEDYEVLARQTPGARVARAAARANLHPSFPCFKAPGLITLVVLPDSPVPRPMPGRELRRAVEAYLQRRRVIGTRIQVIGPEYLEVAVRARIKACSGASKAALQQRITEALNLFFDPLKGGPEGTGWPFGRDVYRSEVMQVIEEVAGVDHILSLELLDRCRNASCGNVCLGPTWIVAAGTHELEVV